MSHPGLLSALTALTTAMVDDLAALVEVETPSHDLVATARGADVVAGLGTTLLGTPPERIDTDGRVHLRWRFGTTTRVVLIGHLDTVWPLATIDRWAFTVDGDVATGPGAFDMKAGLVQGLYALAQLDDLGGVALLVTSDEEIGSPSSRALVEETSYGARAALVLEPSADGALKTARKGVSNYRVAVTGRAAHAGLEPERGVNAAIEVAHQVLALAALADPALGTTVTPTVLAAGTATNVVPAAAYVDVNVRAVEPAEQERVDSAMRRLAPVIDGATMHVIGGPNRPPMPASASATLLELAQRAAAELGLSKLRSVGVGGGSDGNFTAGIGVPTLDGLGAVGDGAHAEGEHVVISAMAPRAALVAALVAELHADA